MPNRKRLRERGKIRLSEYFKELKPGDRVALKKEKSVMDVGFHKRVEGVTGIVEKKQGRSYVIKIKDLNMEKKVVIPPIHLKRIYAENKSKGKNKK